MTTVIRVMAAGSLLVAACSASGSAVETSTSAPAGMESPAIETTVPMPTTTVAAVASTVPATTTTIVAETTTTIPTTEPPVDVNPLEVEVWWCEAFAAAGGQSATDFAQALLDDFRHGYSSMPAETIADGAEQAAIVQCDPEYGQAVAAVLVE